MAIKSKPVSSCLYCGATIPILFDNNKQYAIGATVIVNFCSQQCVNRYKSVFGYDIGHTFVCESEQPSATHTIESLKEQIK